MKPILFIIFLIASCNPPQQSNQSSIQTSNNSTIQQSRCEWCGAMDAPKELSWKTQIAPPDEPGDPMIISGTIYQPDGKTPAEGVLVYVYHTNNKGLYEPKEPIIGNEKRHGHLRGWMRTNADGKYQFRSVKPAPYPNRNDPAHIHVTLSSEDFEEYWIPSTLFKSDPFLSPKQIHNAKKVDRFGNIISLQKDKNGILKGKRDIRLKE